MGKWSKRPSPKPTATKTNTKMSVKKEANLAACIKTVLESRLEVLDKDLAKVLLDKYQYETSAQERMEAIKNSNDLINNSELKTLEGKVVYCWKDELTKQAEKADLTEVEM